MYKLLIVDDEVEIRNGLRYLDWNSVGLEPVAECEHGLEACQWLESHSVDLVLTDIRMPVMNGLELSKHLFKRYPHAKTIVLSGYNDFELARESMRYGTLDYLLKPINPEELLAVAASAVECLHREGQRRDVQKKLERKIRHSIKLLRQQFLRRLLFQSVGPDELQEGCAASEMLLEGLCSAGAIRLDLKCPWEQAFPEKERKLISFAFDNMLSELWDEAGYGYHYIDSATGRAFLLMAGEPPDAGEMKRLLESLKQSLMKFRGLFRTTLSIAFGTAQPPQSANRSCQEALAALDAAGKDALTFYDGSGPPSAGLPGFPGERIPDMAGHPAVDKPEKTAHYLVNAAREYVARHYDRPLSLQEVAQHVHVNPSYLSHLFKEATGDTFVHFLTSCRINRAKDLLAEPQYKVYEVGHIVGYENPRYFAEIFKKFTGKTPYEYRSQ